LLFLAWYCLSEPPSLTGFDTASSLNPSEYVQAVYASFEDTIEDDLELLLVIGIMAYLSPWAFGQHEATWLGRSVDFLARYRASEGLTSDHFATRGAYGTYFGHPLDVAGNALLAGQHEAAD
jgi:hypothetical protein